MRTLEEAVAALPDTADGIAAMLVEEGIMVSLDDITRDLCMCCPLAVWLSILTGECVGVGGEYAWIGEHSAPPFVYFPHHVQRFVGSVGTFFNAYPELVR